jgi:hypothetical protein
MVLNANVSRKPKYKPLILFAPGILQNSLRRQNELGNYFVIYSQFHSMLMVALLDLAQVIYDMLVIK